ncbi:Mth938-like domain-containing protein [Sphingomonas sp.]|jgi:uncharacterized protein|uniref:Mth938-like domain-containing protein n=1 Tax=Sphingomonas sp. TaxID=28214 RepID=UPI002D7EB9F3|nr:Mth938-like domain-containing protein [Sphingomonas sp.]HEU0043718.1 Mth938-like domain-containing protein [Sphingomonas sp.]
MERSAAAPGPMVQGFGANGFRIDGAYFRAALLTVTTATAWSPPPLEALTTETLTLLLAERPEFILLGTGPTLRRPPLPLIAALDAAGIGLEPMDSRAAARAWGILRVEGRQVAAALYPLD